MRTSRRSWSRLPPIVRRPNTWACESPRPRSSGAPARRRSGGRASTRATRPWASGPRVDASYAAIAQVLAEYFDGLHYSDSERLSRVFHSRAHYVCPTEDALVYRTMAEYFPIVDARPSPASRGETRRDRIISIELGGPALAFVRAECSIGPKFFTDF